MAYVFGSMAHNNKSVERRVSISGIYIHHTDTPRSWRLPEAPRPGAAADAARAPPRLLRRAARLRGRRECRAVVVTDIMYNEYYCVVTTDIMYNEY